MKHQARKRFGQHFLTDTFVIEQIISAIAPVAGEHMVEIGPGLAALTQPLVERLGKLTVIELDRDLVLRLQTHPQLVGFVVFLFAQTVASHPRSLAGGKKIRR